MFVMWCSGGNGIIVARMTLYYALQLLKKQNLLGT